MKDTHREPGHKHKARKFWGKDLGRLGGRDVLGERV